MILDTNILVDLLKGRENKLKDIFEKLDEEFIVKGVTSISVMELWRGTLNRINNEKEKKEIDNLLKSLLIFNFDEEAAKEAAEIEFKLIKKGDIIDLEDIMIAAITKMNNEVLLTYNTKHFKRVDGLKVEGVDIE